MILKSILHRDARRRHQVLPAAHAGRTARAAWGGTLEGMISHYLSVNVK
ncbi:hypothetical protein PT2222_10030 [Paraburkholderia tropica]